MAYNASAGLTYDYINGTVSVAVSNKETNLRTTISALGDNASATDLLKLQQQTNEWNMMIQIQSTIVKSIGDAMSGIISKAG